MRLRKILSESLDYGDLHDLVKPYVTIDEYSSKIGDDDQIITMTFHVRGEQAGNDLVYWFERGYEWILDAELSVGEIRNGWYLVFVEMQRRYRSPQNILEVLSDLETLTGLKLSDWTVNIQDREVSATLENLRDTVKTSPRQYRNYIKMLKAKKEKQYLQSK